MVKHEAKKVVLTDSEGNYIVPVIDPADKGSVGLEIGDIGIAPLGIDESKGLRRYLNGQILIQEQYKVFTNKLKNSVALYPTLACTEEEWQTTTTMTVGGQVGKFVIDDNAGTIRLPKIIMPIQGLTNLANLAEIVEAGLPNITAYWKTVNNGTAQGAVYNSWSGGELFDTGEGGGWGKQSNLNLDASRSSSVYSNSDTVQQEQIQYPYFIQVATGAETVDNIVNEIELNNPFSLLDYKFSEYELNNISWLRSNGQYNSKAVYPAVYELLLKIYNGTETKTGVSVKLITETFTDYDFVLNTADETFSLPTKVKLASGKAVVGNGYGLGLNDANEDGAHYLSEKGAGENGVVYFSDSITTPQLVGTSITQSSGVANNTIVGVITDPTKSGIETSDSDLYLYFYVGETVQNANLINAGRIEEKLADIEEKLADSLTINNRQELISWGMPDYAKKVGKSTGTSYKADTSGWLFVQTGKSDDKSDFSVVIDGITFRTCGNTTASEHFYFNFMLPVGKGSTYQVNKGGYSLTVYFIPCKGV